MSAESQASDLKNDTAATEKFICFWLGDQEFALPIAMVREVVPSPHITPLTSVSAFVLGIINLRGEIVAVLDIAMLFGLPPAHVTGNSRVVIVEHAGLTAGLMADRIEKVKELAREAVAPPPMTLDTIRSNYLQGVVQLPDHPLMVMSLEHIMNTEELLALRREP